MILYLDASAIVKQYVFELGSAQVQAAVVESEINGTSIVSRAEVHAALRKATRVGVIEEKAGSAAVRDFDRNWPSLVRTRVTERLVKHAGDLAWTHNLRGFDSLHLASAAAWQQALGREVTLASFDRALWAAAERIGLLQFPIDLPQLLRP